MTRKPNVTWIHVFCDRTGLLLARHISLTTETANVTRFHLPYDKKTSATGTTALRQDYHMWYDFTALRQDHARLRFIFPTTAASTIQLHLPYDRTERDMNPLSYDKNATGSGTSALRLEQPMQQDHICPTIGKPQLQAQLPYDRNTPCDMILQPHDKTISD